MSLNTRFLGLATALILCAGGASWWAYQTLSQSIIERWGRQVTEIQVRYDSARLLSSLEREIGLAKQLARTPVLKQWALEPDNSDLKTQAIRELENFRAGFGAKSYFIALTENRHYYFNNAQNDYADDQFRYILDPASGDDAWFFQLVEEGRDFHLNVNPDTQLGVTKLWIDVLVRSEAGEVVAMVGTGLNLDAFLQDIVDIGQEGITTLFADYNGAIQLYRDRNYIDFASIIKPEGQKKTVDLLFEHSQDKQKMLGMLALLKKRGDAPGSVESGFVVIDGKKHLVGVAYLPSIGWFEITLLDLSVLVPKSYFWPLGLVFLATLIVTLTVFHWVIRSRVLKPVVSLEAAVHRVREGNYDLPYLPKPDNEIGRLADHFEKMTDRVRRNTEELEARVEHRTEQLHRQARTDPLTDLKNRRGLDDILNEMIVRAEREQVNFGILWIDVDHFKSINDEHGHQFGDEILRRVALWLRASIRPYDQVGRWGGDEFVVVMGPCEHAVVMQAAERIRAMVAEESVRTGTPLTLSVGAHWGLPGESIDTLLHHADIALYRAKGNGRNKVVID
ncbi:GGDEF domain-containing protein [Gilvimarinus agarilyticus]|uniref:GGDEF domain-containing protein n=1 Tax=Gilvimarinus sp. 2_MG-2023 TaxID=3062666 RepID=UPI001C08A787|nr:GGDEF domain-containing protein [Gilvimarinus sp. 2_MG-2023]MBU2887517.1 GGDEF domain-containing protein [Gilvimarinus agarilyticus]MDO6572168.1 GGDEF domain-containing protein [Gilvimarinus sp. 2_MG-2023]